MTVGLVYQEQHQAHGHDLGRALRRELMAGRLGIRLRPKVLPLSNLAGCLLPCWLAPGLAMRKG
jgi:hypothetical protein